MQTPVGFLFYQIALAMQGPLRLHMNLKNFSNSVKKCHRVKYTLLTARLRREATSPLSLPLYDPSPFFCSAPRLFYQILSYLLAVSFLCPAPSNIEWWAPEVRLASLSLGSHLFPVDGTLWKSPSSVCREPMGLRLPDLCAAGQLMRNSPVADVNMVIWLIMLVCSW